jgi:hypothetical protein
VQTHHLDRNRAYTAKVHPLMAQLQILSVDTVEALSEETYNQIMPSSLDTARP